MTEFGSDGMISFDFSEMSALQKQITKAAKKGTKDGKLTVAQMKTVWRITGRQIAKIAASNAPSSGRKGDVTWRRKGSGSVQYVYKGQHGDIRRQRAYKVSPWRTGRGVNVRLGGSVKDKEGATAGALLRNDAFRLAGLIGKFVHFGITPTGKIAERNLLGDALARTMPSQARIIVETYDKAMAQETLNKAGVR